jgi:ABC-type multidrug transport system fused ATPase/permease subunit
MLGALARLYPLADGAILVDGHDLCQVVLARACDNLKP